MTSSPPWSPSNLSTAAKHGRTFLDTLVMLAEGRPWMPETS
jgi:hypothetical protein